MSLIPSGFVLRRFVLVVLVLVIMGGCAKGKAADETCGNKTVEINSTAGANPDSVYVCHGDTVQWVSSPRDLKFEVEFKNGKFPFKGTPKKFINGDPPSEGTKWHFFKTPYPYKITVYTPNPVVSDPQVVAGGGL